MDNDFDDDVEDDWDDAQLDEDDEFGPMFQAPIRFDFSPAIRYFSNRKKILIFILISASPKLKISTIRFRTTTVEMTVGSRRVSMLFQSTIRR